MRHILWAASLLAAMAQPCLAQATWKLATGYRAETLHTQNIQQFRWSLERVIEELESRMVATFNELMTRAARDGTAPREAAFDIAVERVARAIKLRGFV